MQALSKGDRVIFTQDWGDGCWFCWAKKGTQGVVVDVSGGKYYVNVNGKRNDHPIPRDFLEKL